MNVVCTIQIVVTQDEYGIYGAGVADWCTLHTYNHATPEDAVRLLLKHLHPRVDEVVNSAIALEQDLGP